MKLSIIFHVSAIILLSIIISGILVTSAYGDNGLLPGIQYIPSEVNTPHVNILPQTNVDNIGLSLRIETTPYSDIDHSVYTSSKDLQSGIASNISRTGKTSFSGLDLIQNQTGQKSDKSTDFINSDNYFTPTITSITPSSGVNTASVYISNLSGTGFKAGVKVILTRIGRVPVFGTEVAISDNFTKITCKLPIAGKPMGSWNVVVVNTDGQAAIMPNGFLITSPAPTIACITPSSGVNTAPVIISNLSGTGFQRGAIVKLTQTGQSDIFATKVHVVSSRKITCNIPINRKEAGAWNVVVINKDGETAVMPNGFTITGPPNPTISSITPSSAYPTAHCKITITGTNFRSNPVVKIMKGVVTKTATILRTTRTQIIATLPTARIAPGVYTLIVQNKDGTSATLINAFTVNSPGNNPTITTINPKTGFSSANTKVTITGTNFREGVVVQMIKGTTVRNAYIKSRISTKIVCILPTKGTRTGFWNLTIKNADMTNVTKTGFFTVKKGGIASNQVDAGSTGAVLLNTQQPAFGSGISPEIEPLQRRVQVPDISPFGSSILY